MSSLAESQEEYHLLVSTLPLSLTVASTSFASTSCAAAAGVEEEVAVVAVVAVVAMLGAS
jgi:hypothetical protein